MTRFGLDHEARVIVLIIIIIIAFALVAKLDWVFGERDVLMDSPVVLPWKITIGQHWLWMNIGYVVFAVFIAFIYLLAAPATERNLWYGFGLGATVILFAVGQLEDFLWHPVNGFSFPTGDWAVWGWTAENNLLWAFFGTWNTPMHLIWFSLFCLVLVPVMWWAIFRRT